jgi:hypothetical protein
MTNRLANNASVISATKYCISRILLCALDLAGLIDGLYCPQGKPYDIKYTRGLAECLIWLIYLDFSFL